MKKLELGELKNKTKEELVEKIKILKEDILKLSFDIRLGREKNTAKIRNMKKDVARMLMTLAGIKNAKIKKDIKDESKKEVEVAVKAA
ncbi:MAG: 50S ribosomal protein L29 [Candidatus Levybacteria bacterium CG10_big_fil_rev_8_21_14_0_10_36_7]|nr:MAG: 50S ribosomal protein L29 [Candidatus Levybacteria bacterium CG10_big_fil_rev_8_21_14_0_10_36_7]